MKWKVIESPPATAQQNMDRDRELLSDLDPNGPPILHFYQWKNPSVTVGHFIRPEKHLHVDVLSKHGLDIGKRPTGGGVIFHLWDFAFSVLIPAKHEGYSLNTLENYAWVNQRIGIALKPFLKGSTADVLINPDKPISSEACHFCMAHPTVFDLMVDGQKLGGAAQRKTKNGFLHQGTISVESPDLFLLKDVLVGGEALAKEMERQSFTLSQYYSSRNIFLDIKESILNYFS